MFYEIQPKGSALNSLTNLMPVLVKDAPIDEATISELEDMLEQHCKSIEAKKNEKKEKVKE